MKMSSLFLQQHSRRYNPGILSGGQTLPGSMKTFSKPIISPMQAVQVGFRGTLASDGFHRQPTMSVRPIVHGLNVLSSRTGHASRLPVRFVGYNPIDDAICGTTVLGEHESDPELDELDADRKEIWHHLTTKREGLPHGYLDPADTIFKIVNMEKMSKLGARGGFGERFSHWKWGQAAAMMYLQESLGYRRTYEMVVPTVPAVAYLLDRNHPAEQALVMAHVYAHADFFKNNMLYKNMNPNIQHRFADNKAVIDAYHNDPAILRASRDKNENPVELFLNKLFSVEELIDSGHNTAKSEFPEMKYRKEDAVSVEDLQHAEPYTNESDDFNDFLLPQAERRRREDAAVERRMALAKKFPLRPTRDILGVIVKHSKVLEPWQKDILTRFREEAYYYSPIVRTQIANEGWATWWERRALLNTPELRKDKYLSYTLASTAAMLNYFSPYSLGFYIWDNIHRLAGKGLLNVDLKAVKTHEALQQLMHRPHDENRALNAMYEIRKYTDDLSFIQTYFTIDVAKRMRPLFEQIGLLDPLREEEVDDPFFSPAPTPPLAPGQAPPPPKRPRNDVSEEEFELIKSALISQYDNTSQPIIELVNANYNNRDELMLLHQEAGHGALDNKKMEQTLRIIYSLWGRPVHLETANPEKSTERLIYTCTSEETGVPITKRKLAA